MQQAHDVAPEAQREGVVEVQLRAQPGDGGGVGPLSDHGLDRIARRHIEQQERRDQHAAERRHEKQQPAPQRVRHGAGVRRTPVQRCPLKMTGSSHPVMRGDWAHKSTGNQRYSHGAAR